jgi:hypothetical protein
MRTDIGELLTEVARVDRVSTPLGTAQWMGASEARARLAMQLDRPSDRIWIGQDCEGGTPLGYAPLDIERLEGIVTRR